MMKLFLQDLFSENFATSFPMCCFAFGPILFSLNSIIGFVGNSSCLNSKTCSNPDFLFQSQQY